MIAHDDNDAGDDDDDGDDGDNDDDDDDNNGNDNREDGGDDNEGFVIGSKVYKNNLKSAVEQKRQARKTVDRNVANCNKAFLDKPFVQYQYCVSLRQRKWSSLQEMHITYIYLTLM